MEPKPDPYLILLDPDSDSGGPETSGSTALFTTLRYGTIGRNVFGLVCKYNTFAHERDCCFLYWMQTTLIYLTSAAVATVGASYAAVPLYRSAINQHLPVKETVVSWIIGCRPP